MEIRESLQARFLPILNDIPEWKELIEAILSLCDFSLVEDIEVSDFPSSFTWILDSPYCGYSIVTLPDGSLALAWELNIDLPQLTYTCITKPFYYNGEITYTIDYTGGSVYFLYEGYTEIGTSVVISASGSSGGTMQPLVNYTSMPHPFPFPPGSLYAAKTASYLSSAIFTNFNLFHCVLQCHDFYRLNDYQLYLPNLSYVYYSTHNEASVNVNGDSYTVVAFSNHVLTVSQALPSTLTSVKVVTRVQDLVTNEIENTYLFIDENEVLQSFILQCIPHWYKGNVLNSVDGNTISNRSLKFCL